MKNVMFEKVLKTIRRYEMVCAGDKVIVAVSGGPDSVFLTRALNTLGKKLNMELSIVHLDHGLRGEESTEDAEFVKGLARSLKLEFIHKRINLRELKDRKLSVEEAARLERYKFFREAAAKKGANVVATAHTLDDQAETVLINLIRGASTKGASGIPPVREDADGLKIIRPLVELQKSEMLEYLAENKIAYRIDSSNLQNEYFRNVVRREIIPFLERFNPRVKRALSNFAGHLREDLEFMRRAKAESAKRLSKKTGERISFDLKDIVVQPRALAKEIIRDSLETIGGDVKKLSYRHWRDIDSFLRVKRKGSSLDLPGGVRLSRKDRTLELFKNKTLNSPVSSVKIATEAAITKGIDEE